MEASRFFAYEKDLSPLRKRIRVRPFRGLLVREGEAHRCDQSLSERTLRQLLV